jgi:hypothetical protein
MVIAGEYDFIYCMSQCNDILRPGAAPVLKKARAFKAVSYPGAGYGLNFASNATGAYEIITDFLGDIGLQSDTANVVPAYLRPWLGTDHLSLS